MYLCRLDHNVYVSWRSGEQKKEEERGRGRPFNQIAGGRARELEPRDIIRVLYRGRALSSLSLSLSFSSMLPDVPSIISLIRPGLSESDSRSLSDVCANCFENLFKGISVISILFGSRKKRVSCIICQFFYYCLNVYHPFILLYWKV